MTATTADSALAADAAAGLWQDPPVLPTKWLYDEPQGRSHKQPWQPVAIIFGIILL